MGVIQSICCFCLMLMLHLGSSEGSLFGFFGGGGAVSISKYLKKINVFNAAPRNSTLIWEDSKLAFLAVQSEIKTWT